MNNLKESPGMIFIYSLWVVNAMVKYIYADVMYTYIFAHAYFVVEVISRGKSILVGLI